MNGKKLYRSRTDRKLFGVCGGLAAYFGIDSTIVRLIAAAMILTGTSLIFYLVAALIIPEEPAPTGYYDDGGANNS